MSAQVLSWPFNARLTAARWRHTPPAPAGAGSTRRCAATAPRPGPQSQSFSRSYGSILPTSLIYIILSTRGYSPWRPDAVMSTAKREDKTFPWIFKDCDERTGYSENRILYQAAFLSSGQSKISRRARGSLLRRKENSSQGSSQCLQVHLCCHLSQVTQ